MSATLDSLIQNHGLTGVFLVTTIEGESGVLMGGALAGLGRMNLLAVIAAGWAGAFLFAVALFALSRSHRDHRLIARIHAKPSFARALRWIERNPVLFCFFYRFVYGLRIAGPVAVAMSRVPPGRFIAINLVSALAWSALGTLIAWRFGPGIMSWLLGWMTPVHLFLAFAAVLSVMLGYFFWPTRGGQPSQSDETSDPASTAD